MDENMARMMEQLKRNPAQLQKLLRTPDGQALLQLLNKSSQNGLQGAMRSASQGKPEAAMEQISNYLKTPDGAALAARIQKIFGK